MLAMLQGWMVGRKGIKNSDTTIKCDTFYEREHQVDMMEHRGGDLTL